jgi:hypothetical protein
MMAVLLVFAVLCQLTFGIMMVAAAAALPPQRFRTARYQAEEKSLALLRSWLTPEQHACPVKREGALNRRCAAMSCSRFCLVSI